MLVDGRLAFGALAQLVKQAHDFAHDQRVVDVLRTRDLFHAQELNRKP